VRIELIWSSETIEHILTKHDITPKEVEEGIYDDVPIKITTRQNRFMVYCQTNSGRYIMVIISKPSKGKSKVITARDMTPVEKRNYKRKIGR